MYANELLIAIKAAMAAGSAIMGIYGSDFAVTLKKDKSPLTIADQKSHEIIKKHLEILGIPILSEEGKEIPYKTRKHWGILWIVDPLDGTKEFIKRNGEFTVNIALVEKGKPVLGVIFVPVQNTLYWAESNMGSFVLKINAVAKIKMSSVEEIKFQSEPLPLPEEKTRRRPFTIIGTRSHVNADLENFVAEKRREFGEVDYISVGSSLKFCRVAEGRADIYPRLNTTMEWDTAAGQVIVEMAERRVVCLDTKKPLVYNKENLQNPYFIVS